MEESKLPPWQRCAGPKSGQMRAFRSCVNSKKEGEQKKKRTLSTTWKKKKSFKREQVFSSTSFNFFFPLNNNFLQSCHSCGWHTMVPFSFLFFLFFLFLRFCEKIFLFLISFSKFLLLEIHSARSSSLRFGGATATCRIRADAINYVNPQFCEEQWQHDEFFGNENAQFHCKSVPFNCCELAKVVTADCAASHWIE